jgi:hypothetical protein
MVRIMRASRLLGLLLVALLGASLLSAPAASAVDPRQDRTRLPRACASPAEEVPRDALICKLTPFRANRPTVMFWGDSHVWMQIPGLLRAAQGRNVNVITSLMGSCPPMDPGLSYEDRYRLGICAASNVLAVRKVRELANGSQDFKLVLAGNWEMYERLLKLLAAGKKPGPGKEYPFAQSKIFKQGGPRLFRELGQWGVDVDIVHQVARAPAKGKPCKRMDPYACNFPRRQAFDGESGTKRWLERVSRPARVNRYVDVNDHLCSPSTCFAKIDGAWTYHDNSHITASMARQLWRYYAPAVADVVPGMVAPPPGDGGDGSGVLPEPEEPPCTVPLFCR